ncbi:M15 family metallopeptidase [Ureibacillus acetophenoni]|uniref:D-alanyl-D-alanine carboxypeptidase n=1 Tax=Ureibacillus acetophenoni TaxID=614649 RepID=A0A285UP84_9BACL|nr:M15 family metallopeptidase [Ureibacillus acetophenoni]SOC42071.1 D-alanyl-D-alanine carboxypeptidase [Ureibacillus acetophenoni]
MKRSSISKKTNSKLSIITIVLLVIAIIAILFFTSNKNENSKEEEGDLEQKEIVAEDPVNEESQKPEEVKEESDDISGDSNEQSKEPINKEENNEESKPNQDEKPKVDNGYIVDQTLPTTPTYIDGVLIANKKYPLPKDFNPGEDVEARVAFEEMASAARKVGYEITAFSTFRSFEYQTTLYNRYVERDGKDNADRYSARPGYSEHQTGLAFDIGEVGREDVWLTSEFGETEAGKWLLENAHNYGFILRYPKGKEDITGYMYESWHFRYLGIPLATEVKQSGLTLEEYLGID